MSTPHHQPEASRSPRAINDPLAAIMAAVKTHTGINLTEAKRLMAQVRLERRLRTLGIDMTAYARLLRKDPDEIIHAIDLLSTNHSFWMREAAHFADLRQRVLPSLTAQRGRQPAPRLRIWCAAAATGDEPYSIALTVLRSLPQFDRWQVEILATDISTRALAQARAGRFDERHVAALDPAERQLALDVIESGPPKLYEVKASLRKMVTFSRLNLIEDWSVTGRFDVIFCRNVMIYFDQETRQRLVDRLIAMLAPGGTLYVGLAESLFGVRHSLRALGKATYVSP